MSSIKNFLQILSQNLQFTHAWLCKIPTVVTENFNSLNRKPALKVNKFIGFFVNLINCLNNTTIASWRCPSQFMIFRQKRVVIKR
jgi:hypothetical protein